MSSELLKYSNPVEVQRKLSKYLNTPVARPSCGWHRRPLVDLYQSTRRRKKYMIQSREGKWIHFGAMGYADYTKHKDEIRRIHYLQRATAIKGHWKENPYSANNLAIHGLW
jgi:hypothetical protein